MTAANAIERWANVVRYHRPAQLLRRLEKRTLGALRQRRMAPLLSATPPERSALFELPPRTRHRMAGAAADLSRGRLTLLNLGASIGRPFDWRLEAWPDAPDLWAFQLQYHEYLAALADADERRSTQNLIWETLESWLQVYDGFPRDRVAWHPYCISRRIPIWCRLLVRCNPFPELRTALCASLAEQAESVRCNLERDLGGNHLWENAKALATAGSFFAGDKARQWLDGGIELLNACVAEQLLPWGEHYERSAMYQADLAGGLIDLSAWLEPVRPDAADFCRATAGKMLAFLDATRHPDGQAPLFGDSADSVVDEPICDSTRRRHRDQGAVSEWTGRYFLHRHRDCQLIFDAGDLGPDELPAHAHADLLGFELSMGGVRIATDSGAFCYAGKERNAYRGSAAHNVLTVDGIDHADVWSSFRMGRRGHVVERSWGRIDGNVWVRARHDAYEHIGVAVDRYWLLAADGPWFSVHIVHGPSTAVHQLCERIHWHPGVRCNATDSPRRKALRSSGGEFTWALAAECAVGTAWSNYSPDFYVALERPVFCLVQESELPALSAWCVCAEPGLTDARVVLDGRWLRAGWRMHGRLFDWAAPIG